MKDINNYILEKLKINKDSKVNHEGDYDFYWTGEVEDYEHMPKEFFDRRKSNRKINGIQKNKAWYAVYLYLTINGKQKVNKIREDLWPGKSGQQAELFTGLRYCKIIESIVSGPDRGYQIPNPFSKWLFKNTLNGIF